MPSTSENLAKQLGVKVTSWEQAKHFDIKPGHPIGKPSVIFTKVKPDNPGQTDQSLVSIKEFGKLDIRIGRIKSAQKIPNSKKLVKLEVEVGEETRTIVAGIAEHYTPEELVGKFIAVVLNLEPAKLMGVTSEGMLLAAEDEKGISLLVADRPIKTGSKVK
jgi:methionyl-tRNA synthetase